MGSVGGRRVPVGHREAGIRHTLQSGVASVVVVAGATGATRLARYAGSLQASSAAVARFIGKAGAADITLVRDTKIAIFAEEANMATPTGAGAVEAARLTFVWLANVVGARVAALAATRSVEAAAARFAGPAVRTLTNATLAAEAFSSAAVAADVPGRTGAPCFALRALVSLAGVVPVAVGLV